MNSTKTNEHNTVHKESIVLPTFHFAKRVRQQYNNVCRALIRELIQNSMDAGATTLHFSTPDTHKLIASDNGCGMSLEEFRKYYLALGGSKKPPGSLGCFGAAKELTFAMAHWEIRSLDFVCTGQGAADIVSIEQPGRKNGFTVIYDESEKQESARLFNSIQVGKHLAHIMSLSNIPMQIKLNGETVKQGRTLSNLKLLSNSIAGDGRLYVYRGKKFRQNEWPGELYIRVKGLFTAIDHVQSEYCYYLELEQVSNKILSENRDYLLYHVKREVCDVIDKYELEQIKKGRLDKKAKITHITVCSHNFNRDWTETAIGEDDTVKILHYMRTNDNIGDYAIVHNRSIKSRLFHERRLKKKYRKPLGIISYALQMVKMLDPEIKHYNITAGLLLDTEDANAICLNIGSISDIIIAVKPNRVLNKHAFLVLETVVHELSHVTNPGHGQEYESRRMEIMSRIAKQALSIIAQIDMMQKKR